MNDFEPGPPHTHGEAAAIIGTFYKGSYSRLLGLVRTRFRSLEPDEMVQELFLKILDHLDSIRADDPEALGLLIKRWTTPDYISRSLINLCLDVVRSGPSRREDATDPQEGAGPLGGDDLMAHAATMDRRGNLLEYEPPGLYPQCPDQVAPHLDTLRSQQAVNAMLQALLERGRHTRGHRSHITERQLDILVAVYNSNRPATEEFTELSDDELHRLTLEVDKRARARWRATGGHSEPDAGNQAAAAAELGISRQAVSQSLKAVAAALTITRYIAGVLAPSGTLLNPSLIHIHLDQVDQLPERPDGAKHHSILTAAAPAVRTTPDRGTRVQPALLVGQDQIAGEEQVEAVHAAETYLAWMTGTSHPNCVNACESHTQQLDRAIEI